MKRFRDLQVVELAGSVAGAYMAKLFADYGGRVLKVEPPSGDPMRRTGPRDESGESVAFAYLNTGKASLGLDTTCASGQALLRELLANADVLIESFSPGPPRPLPDDITQFGPLVRVCISPFGTSGPYSEYRSTPFTDFATSGHMYLTGEPDREPLQGAPDQPLFAAGTHGFVGALAALLHRDVSGLGQDVEVSHFEVMASLHQWTTVRYTHGGVIQRRVGNRYGSLHPSTIYRCRDGWVAFAPVGNEPLARFLAVVGMEELLDDPRFSTGAARFDNADAFDAILEPWMLEHTVGEVVAFAQAVRAPVAPVNTLESLLADPHLAARDYWRRPSGITTGPFYPGPPFRMSGHEWSLTRAPAVGRSGERAPEIANETKVVYENAGLMVMRND